MVLEIFLKQKKVKVKQAEIPLTKVKIGTKNGNGYFFTGDIDDVKKREKELTKETEKIFKEIQKLKYQKVQLEKKISVASDKLANADAREQAWKKIVNREVVEFFPSIDENGTINILVEGNEHGKLWTCGERKCE